MLFFFFWGGGGGEKLVCFKNWGLMVVTKLQKQILLSTYKQSATGFRPVLIFYPVRDKAKQFDQNSQGIHPVRLESSLCA